jgi:hypothetical protein
MVLRHMISCQRSTKDWLRISGALFCSKKTSWPQHVIPHDHLLLDSARNIGPLISRWELDKLKNWWHKSFRTFKILALLYQQFWNLLISQRDMSGPRLGALSNDTWSGGSHQNYVFGILLDILKIDVNMLLNWEFAFNLLPSTNSLSTFTSTHLWRPHLTCDTDVSLLPIVDCEIRHWCQHRPPKWNAWECWQLCFTAFDCRIQPNHLLLDSVPNLGPLISRWEINKFEDCWYKSVRILEVL